MVNDMRKPLGVASTIALLSLTCCLTGAAQTASDAFAVRDNQKTVTPEEIVQRFEAPEMTSYTLGDGDEISVDVWNHPELSGKHVVGPVGDTAGRSLHFLPHLHPRTSGRSRDSAIRYSADSSGCRNPGREPSRR